MTTPQEEDRARRVASFFPGAGAGAGAAAAGDVPASLTVGVAATPFASSSTRSRPPTKRARTLPHVLLTVAVAFGMGAVFGMALDRSGVAMPAIIRAQFIWTRQLMIKMWISALGTSALVFAAAHRVAPEAFNQTRARRPWSDKGFVTVAVGGLVQGVGMALTGACPGMVMVQMGVGVPWAYLVFIGALLGAAVHAFVDPLVSAAQKRDFERTYKRWFPKGGFLDKQSWWPSRVPFWAAALGVVAVTAGVDAAFEAAFFWETDAVGVQGVRTASTGLMNPTLAGVCVGLMQIPAFVLLNTFLGTSGGYSWVVSQWLSVVPRSDDDERAVAAGSREKERTSLHTTFSYASNMQRSNAYWQVVYGLGAVLGGWLSATGAVVPPPRPTDPIGVGPALALSGGFLLMYGARMAGGCASGHGLSGVPLLAVSGWTAVPCMFGGAIATGFLLDRAIPASGVPGIPAAGGGYRIEF